MRAQKIEKEKREKIRGLMKDKLKAMMDKKPKVTKSQSKTPVVPRLDLGRLQKNKEPAQSARDGRDQSQLNTSHDVGVPGGEIRAGTPNHKQKGPKDNYNKSQNLLPRDIFSEPHRTNALGELEIQPRESWIFSQQDPAIQLENQTIDLIEIIPEKEAPQATAAIRGSKRPTQSPNRSGPSRRSLPAIINCSADHNILNPGDTFA